MNPKTNKKSILELTLSVIFQRFLGTLFLLIIFQPNTSAQQNDELKTYTDFLEKQNTSAKDYILNLFENYNIIILCERDHREITQYDLILDILRDKRFADNVQNAYFEIGNEKNNKLLNAFLHTPNLSSGEISKTVMTFQRNSYGAPLWEKANYAYFLKGIYEINTKFREESKINIFGLDIGVDWETAREEDIILRDSLVSTARDSVMASNFIHLYKEQGRTNKALVVLNYRHSFLKDLPGFKNAGRFIAEAFPEDVANVYINSFGIDRNQQTQSVEIVSINDGKWDAAFIKSNKNNIGFNFADTPFCNDVFDLIPLRDNYTFCQFFTGFVYYTYFPDLRIVTGIKDYIDDEFAPELMRRYELEQRVYKNQLPDIETLKENYNTVTDKTYKEDKEDFGKALKQIDKWLK